MNQQLDSLFIFKITPGEAIANLLVALLCGILISFFYRATYKGVSYSSNYVISIIMLAMVTAMVIMVIGNNLARAFGLVGAMSIIRFRTAVKDTQDIMFIFFALAAGLACGASMYLIALIGTLTIGFSLLGMSLVMSENPLKREYLLQILFDEAEEDQANFDPVISTYCDKHKIINAKALDDNRGQVLEVSYYIKLKKEKNAPKMIGELKKMAGVLKVNLFYDEE